jgi:hypothetical protein
VQGGPLRASGGFARAGFGARRRGDTRACLKPRDLSGRARARMYEETAVEDSKDEWDRRLAARAARTTPTQPPTTRRTPREP